MINIIQFLIEPIHTVFSNDITGILIYPVGILIIIGLIRDMFRTEEQIKVQER